ncbi:MAG: Ig-like domain-containing protein [Chitinophagales bacterium]
MSITTLLFAGCIGDDFVLDNIDPVLRITNPVDTIALGTTFQFEQMYLNNVGQEEQVTVDWSSSDPSIISINSTGLATANMIGATTITATLNTDSGTLETATNIIVGMTTTLATQSIMGSIMTTSTYALSGDFVLESTDDGVKLTFADNYNASSALPGLYVYLSNNPNSVANAFEIGAVEVFNGAHDYDIENVGLNDYGYLVYFCKPFNVKVGDGEL